MYLVSYLQGMYRGGYSDWKKFYFKIKVKTQGERRAVPYDESKHEAVIRCSICTGEQVAGFRSREDGNFVGVMVIQSEKDLESFKRLYRVDDVRKIY